MYKGERFNSITHLIGFLLATIGAFYLVGVSITKGDIWKIVGFSIYGLMLILLYTVSTVYHSTRGRLKEIFRQLDYISIYLMIAGTYTPFTLVTLNGPWGWSLFGIIWGLAVIGIIQEIYIGKKTRLYSLIIYPAMGWMIVIAIQPLLKSLSAAGMWWLAAGGLSYTIGIIFFLLDEKFKHFHGIWHLFVLAGSICQFVCLALYVV
ncbi:MAG: hemolysin III [Bdellovibrionales bacterium RIFCSPHIGHO2_01_FULL_40_29]|nr:MAG: hemolysin III [Bdellovibrionales bacterium RIFCSPHIGHO2_01_FULL_40_29]OFZ34455.1 MAG: hemolysin III [Bdellovibrionales bacterium RIFCSPHIGHO2_02_FULL_40_15]